METFRDLLRNLYQFSCSYEILQCYEILKFETGSTKSVENSFWKRLCTCRGTDNCMKDETLQDINGNVNVRYVTIKFTYFNFIWFQDQNILGVT